MKAAHFSGTRVILPLSSALASSPKRCRITSPKLLAHLGTPRNDARVLAPSAVCATPARADRNDPFSPAGGPRRRGLLPEAPDGGSLRSHHGCGRRARARLPSRGRSRGPRADACAGAMDRPGHRRLLRAARILPGLPDLPHSLRVR
eukprot:scaffold55859_cov69-Phaeocystis_antarctica.AAC.1